MSSLKYCLWEKYRNRLQGKPCPQEKVRSPSGQADRGGILSSGRCRRFGQLTTGSLQSPEEGLGREGIEQHNPIEMQCQSYQASPYLMKEGSTCQHHGQLTGVVGVVQPGLVRDVPRMVTAREPNNAVPCFPPHP